MVKSQHTARGRPFKRIHGHYAGSVESKVHKAWRNMISRCRDRRLRCYVNYGGRGISVCERWRGANGFQNFLADMGEPPTPRHSIDRFPDKNGNYEPDNCRWATSRQQQNNTRWNHDVIFQGRTQSVSAWAVERGINRATLEARLLRGWDVERALTTPGEAYRRRGIK